PDVNPDPRLAIFRQTDNGIPARMAIFAVLLGVETLVPHSLRDVTWSPPSHIGPDDSVFHGMYCYGHLPILKCRLPPVRESAGCMKRPGFLFGMPGLMFHFMRVDFRQLGDVPPCLEPLTS